MSHEQTARFQFPAWNAGGSVLVGCRSHAPIQLHRIVILISTGTSISHEQHIHQKCRYVVITDHQLFPVVYVTAMDIEEHLVSLVEAATDRFGRLFRYDDDFSTFWIESQIGHTRGRRVTKTVQTLYDRVWRALDAQFPERQVDWPTWPAPRALAHGQDPFLDLTRAKPLTQSSVEAMFPSQVIQQAARGDSKSLFEAIFRSPPLNYDMTWSRRWQPKGLKTTEEEWPTQDIHAAKHHMRLEDIFIAETVVPASASTPQVYRFDYAEQTAKYHQVRERQLRSHLSGISWNGGATRQGLDIAAVLAGTWAYATLQEADQREVDRLAALGHSVVSDESSGLAVSVNSDFVQGPGSCCPS